MKTNVRKQKRNVREFLKKYTHTQKGIYNKEMYHEMNIIFMMMTKSKINSEISNKLDFVDMMQ